MTSMINHRVQTSPFTDPCQVSMRCVSRSFICYFAWSRGVKKCDQYICLSVCPLSYIEDHMAELHQCFAYCSVLFWRRCDTLCISGFAGDVVFSHNGLTVRCVCSWAAIEYDKRNSRDSNEILLHSKDQQLLVVSCASEGGGKSAIYDCPVC